MIKIYCLVDPRTCLPFYIGATSYPLKLRLQGHLTDGSIRTATEEREHLLKELIRLDLRPRIYLLMAVSHDKADVMEKSFYDYFTGLGIQLLQNQYRFTYQSRHCKYLTQNN